LNHRAQGVHRDFNIDIFSVLSVNSFVQEEIQTWSSRMEAVNVGGYLFIELNRVMDFQNTLLARLPFLGKGVAHDR
jgi:hypothetical protein